MKVCLGAIVEGHGEVAALPVLLRRIAQAEFPSTVLQVVDPMRISRGALTRSQGGELGDSLDLMARKVRSSRPDGAGLIVLLDSDDEAPCKLGPQLLERARRARSDLPLSVVCACREYEAWFLAAAASLRGECGLPADLTPPPNPEAIRDAKGWLGDRMLPHGYSPRTDQVALSRLFDLQQARQGAPSFDKLYRDVTRLLREAGARAGA